MGKFKKQSGVQQGAKVQKNLHTVHKTISKNKKEKPMSRNKNVLTLLQTQKHEVIKKDAGLIGDMVEVKKVQKGNPVKNNKDKKENGKETVVKSKKPKMAPEVEFGAKQKMKKKVANGGAAIGQKQELVKQKVPENGYGKKQRDVNNKNKIKKKQHVRKNYVLLRPQTPSADEDESESENEAEASVKLQHLNATLDSSTDSDDNEYDPDEEEDEVKSEEELRSDVSEDLDDLSVDGSDDTEEEAVEIDISEEDSDEEQSDSDEDVTLDINATIDDEEAEDDEDYVPDDVVQKDESMKLKHLDQTLDSSDEEDGDYDPEVDSGDDVESSEGGSGIDDTIHDESALSVGSPKKKTRSQSSKKHDAEEEEQSEDEDSGEEEEESDKDEKKDKERKEYLKDLKPFDEKAFKEIVCAEKVRSIVEALVKQTKEEMSQKKEQIFKDYRYLLQVTCFKIPMCPQRMVKLRLKHSLITDGDDVCFIVKDLERGKKADYEQTINHYQDMFEEKGIKGIKTIIPFNQLRKEYTTYESKIKLSNLYDYYLCDGAIVGHVVGFLGKHFQKPRSTPFAVRMETKDLASEISKIMHKTSFRQTSKGPTIAIPVAHCNMTYDQITDNILTVVDQLKEIYPGGWENIRNMNVKINLKGTSSLPIFVSMCRPPVSVPNVIGPKEHIIKEVKKKANEILRKFAMTQVGDIVKLDSEQTKKRRLDMKLAAQTKAEGASPPSSKKAKVEESVRENSTKTETKTSPTTSAEGKEESKATKLNASNKKDTTLAKSDKSPALQNGDKKLNVSKKDSSLKKESPNNLQKDGNKNKKKVEKDESSDESDDDEDEVLEGMDEVESEEIENDEDDDEDDEEEDDDDEDSDSD